MISFRYHVVSIVAVVAALTVGILLGAGLLDTGLANDLNRRVNTQRQELDRSRDTITQLEQSNGQWSSFGKVVLPSLVSDRLTDVPIVLVTIEGVDLPTLAAARQALVQAGVTQLVTLQIKAKFQSLEPVDRAALAEALGLSATDIPADLTNQAARMLGARLVQAPFTGTPDLIAQLSDAGFVSTVGQPPISSIGVPGQATVFVAGGSHPPIVSPGLVLLPMIRELVDRTLPAPVAAVEPTVTAYPFVPQIRTDDLNRKLLTVDDVDAVFGQMALAVGLQDVLQTPGRGANYGQDTGASAPFPAP
jgi:hypothetical protein